MKRKSVNPYFFLTRIFSDKKALLTCMKVSGNYQITVIRGGLRSNGSLLSYAVYVPCPRNLDLGVSLFMLYNPIYTYTHKRFILKKLSRSSLCQSVTTLVPVSCTEPGR